MTDAIDLSADVVELAPYVPPTTTAGVLREVSFNRRAWLPDEDALVRKLFHDDVHVREIAEAVGRTLHATRGRICDLGLRRNSSLPWSELEDAELLRRYGSEPAATIAQDLGRHVTSVYSRAQRLSLAEPVGPPFSPWEDLQIREGYAQGVPVLQLAVLIGRPMLSVSSRAHDLGVRHVNAPEGWSAEEQQRALQLCHEGHQYTAIIGALADEGFPRRSKSGFFQRIRKLGYGRGWGRRWTADEDELLRRAYQEGASLTPLIERLGRSRSSIRAHVREIGLQGTHKDRHGWRRGRVWTAGEEAQLRDGYGKMPNADLARRLDRDWAAIRVRANHLGLQHGWMRAFTPEEDEAIRIAWRLGLSQPALAEAMNRDTAVLSKHARRHLGLHFNDPNRPARPAAGAVRAPRYTLAEILAMGDAPPASTPAAAADETLGPLLSSMSDATTATIIGKPIAWVRQRRVELRRAA